MHKTRDVSTAPETDLLRGAGLRVTRPRLAVLTAVRQHPHADTDSIIGAVRADIGDVSEEWTSLARKYWDEAGVAGKIDLRIAPAAETLDRLLADGEQDGFDFAFIDADKAGYDGYYERLLRLVRPGGLIALDNTLWGGQVLDRDATDGDTRALQALNTKLAGDDRITLCLLPVADGVTLARRR